MRFSSITLLAIATLVAAPASAEVGYQLPNVFVPANGSDAISGSFDVKLIVNGPQVNQPASAFGVDILVDSTNVVLGDAQAPSNPLFTDGSLLNSADSNQQVQAFQDLYSSSPSTAPLVDGKGLISVPYTIAAPGFGDYTLSFAGFNELVNLAGTPYSLNLSNTGSISVFLGGDFNRDGSVDAADYTTWRDNLGDSVAGAYAGADGDGDGVIDDDDYLVWKLNYGATTGTSGSLGAGAPEPTAAGLAALAGLWGAFRRRR